jgi:hypothetical protein
MLPPIHQQPSGPIQMFPPICCCLTIAVVRSFPFDCIDALDAGLLANSQYPEGPALTGHLGTGFSWFPCV